MYNDVDLSYVHSYVLAAGQAVKLVMRNLGQTIKANISSAPSVGVDIAREER